MSNFPEWLSIVPLAAVSGLVSPDQNIDEFGIAGRTWEASIQFSRYVAASHEASITGSVCPYQPMFSLFARDRTSKTIIDLGSGTAFAALNLSSHLNSADTIILTDLQEVTSLLRSNAHKHTASSPSGSLPQIETRSLDWFKPSEVQSIQAEFPKIDMVMACDLFYFKSLYPPLLRTLLRLASTPEIPVVLAYCVREIAKEEPFWRAFGYWFDYETVQCPSQDPSNVFIFIAHRKAATIHEDVPKDDNQLMYGRMSDTFEMLLLSGIDLSAEEA